MKRIYSAKELQEHLYDVKGTFITKLHLISIDIDDTNFLKRFKKS